MVALDLIIASRSGYLYFSMSSRVLLLRFWPGLGLGFRLSDVSLLWSHLQSSSLFGEIGLKTMQWSRSSVSSLAGTWDCSEGARAKQRKEIDSHTIQLNSLFPSPSSPCVLSARASNTKSSLHVTHRHGTFSRLTRGKSTSPDHAEILRLDQARVNSIHSKLSKKLLTDGVRQSQTTNLPAKHGSIYGSANYVVTVGIGTPKQDQSLIFDTGSDLTWIQCKPCIPTCYSQKEPIFNPYKSSSYKNVLCLLAECRCLYSATGSISFFFYSLKAYLMEQKVFLYLWRELH
ncbi:hypothetical protein F2Q69_00028121 [Brassica cretica]|uniref:Peptidase A1 domain-containing protein n=1 Tax=Brassica cretica TaxID=69181 RepID=A0A8S9S5H1_BRACR|nr:hypothetical protein F2Q69_00028121 [Brassica cretica]